MMNQKSRQLLQKGIAFLSLTLILGCSTAVNQNLSPEEVVRKKAGERWQALIEGRLETAYTYESPEYRKIFDYQKFARGIHGVGLWKKVEVTDVACKEKCVVKMRMFVTIHNARWGDTINSESQLEEQWMRDTDSGDWFHLSSK